MIDEFVAFLGNPGVTFAVGGACGFFTSRFTMTASERSQYKQRLHENGVKHKQEREKRYLDFTNAMRAYCNKQETPSLDDFHSLSTTGDMYFNELQIIADAILSGNVDKNSRDHSFVPAIVEALQKNIPLYYDTLLKVSKRMGLKYDGRFRRSNFESLFRVAEQYLTNDELLAIYDYGKGY